MWKGRIAERLVKLYIRDTLIPKLRREESEFIFWDNPPLPLSEVVCALLEGNKRKIDWEEAYNELVIAHTVDNVSGERRNVRDLPEKERKFYIEQWKRDKKVDAKRVRIEARVLFLKKGLYPNSELYHNTIRLLSLLEVTTDGILFKLNKTGEVIDRKKALSGMKGNTNILLNELPEKIPIVSGDIEVIEIKLGKSNLRPHQKRSYRNIIQEGYGFRFFHVNIISFARNEFEIREKLLTNPSELKSFPLKNVKSLNADDVL